MNLAAFFQNIEAFASDLKKLAIQPVMTVLSPIEITVPAPAAWQKIALFHKIHVEGGAILFLIEHGGDLYRAFAQIRLLIREANAIEHQNIALPESPVLNTTINPGDEQGITGATRQLSWSAFKEALPVLFDSIRVFSSLINGENSPLRPNLQLAAHIAIPAKEPASYFAAKLGLPMADDAILFPFTDLVDFSKNRQTLNHLTELLTDYFEHIPEISEL